MRQGDGNQNGMPIALPSAIAQKPHAAAHLLIAGDDRRRGGAGGGIPSMPPKSISQQPIFFPRENRCPISASFGRRPQHSLIFPSVPHDSLVPPDGFLPFAGVKLLHPIRPVLPPYSDRLHDAKTAIYLPDATYSPYFTAQ
jgi:hypothetical protein